jgi:predicted acyltransferase
MTTPTNTNKRLLALDILRGITIAGMIMVNNPGSWSHIYAPLEHAPWTGLTPTDLVFPFFMFIMGISTYISLKKYHFHMSYTVGMKVLRRTLLIFVIGMAIGWLSRFCYYWTSPTEGIGFIGQLWEAIWSVPRMRIMGVMQRLALCYGATALVALTMKHKHIPYLIAAILVGYLVILITGNGYAYNQTNILSIVDRAILTPAHMYRDNGIDPEGLLSTLPSIAHVLIGFCVGRMMLEGRSKDEDRDATLRSHLINLFLVGTILTFAGFLMSYGDPISKKIWTPSFVLVTCGMASSFLALLIWLIDMKGYKRWSRFFEAFGVNPLFMYVLGGVLSILMGSIRIGGTSIHAWIYGWLCIPFPDILASLLYALLFVALNWCIGYPLYKKGIYIKI